MRERTLSLIELQIYYSKQDHNTIPWQEFNMSHVTEGTRCIVDTILKAWLPLYWSHGRVYQSNIAVMTLTGDTASYLTTDYSCTINVYIIPQNRH